MSLSPCGQDPSALHPDFKKLWVIGRLDRVPRGGAQIKIKKDLHCGRCPVRKKLRMQGDGRAPRHSGLAFYGINRKKSARVSPADWMKRSCPRLWQSPTHPLKTNPVIVILLKYQELSMKRFSFHHLRNMTNSADISKPPKKLYISMVDKRVVRFSGKLGPAMKRLLSKYKVIAD